jgi:hypothetical protein
MMRAKESDEILNCIYIAVRCPGTYTMMSRVMHCLIAKGILGPLWYESTVHDLLISIDRQQDMESYPSLTTPQVGKDFSNGQGDDSSHLCLRIHVRSDIK